MRSIKSENGMITMITLVTILFMISSLVTTYILVANKVKTQKEMINETRSIYEPKSTMEEIYNSYFNNDNIIPIYTVQQLLMMGKEQKDVNINGKYYDFNNDENTIYILMNDLRFKASDYSDQLTNGYWTPIGDNTELIAKFEGRGHTIEVIYDNGSKIYSKENNYSDEEDYKNVIEIFDPNGKDEKDPDYDPNKLHIGDFVNYDAGTWSKEEIEAIKVGPNEDLVQANNSTSLPNTVIQFGGFKEGDSRNGNATPCTQYNYVKDESGEAITGWRVFDIGEDGSITLISAGCPEDYYHYQEEPNIGYISEYILSGNVNTNATDLNLTENYTKRDWSKYVNTSQHATEATVLTKSKLDKWYDKYMGTTNANTYTNSTFRTINGTRYDNLINNYSFYYVPVASNSRYVYCVDPVLRYVFFYGWGARGVRPVVSLSSEVQLKKVDTKTVKDAHEEGKTYTYNVWDIQ